MLVPGSIPRMILSFALTRILLLFAVNVHLEGILNCVFFSCSWNLSRNSYQVDFALEESQDESKKWN